MHDVGSGLESEDDKLPGAETCRFIGGYHSSTRGVQACIEVGVAAFGPSRAAPIQTIDPRIPLSVALSSDLIYVLAQGYGVR